jgi:putative CocE/NonD family hydrolase
MIPLFTDTDSYRDYLYNGGLWNKFNRGGGVSPSCIPHEMVDGIAMARDKYQFYDPAVYGPTGLIHISTDLSKVKVPFYTAMPLEHPGIHIRGSSETYIHAASKHKKLDIISGDISGYPYTQEATAKYMAFFDYWLKGKNNGIMDEPPVRMMVRTGNSGYYWQVENEWPIARTQYKKYYLEATPSNWAGDEKRNDFMRLSPSSPTKETSRTYSAEVNLGTYPPGPPVGGPFRPKRVGGDPGWSHGVSFVTEPLPEDIVIAGYLKLVMWVSSTSSDMDIVAGFRVINENNQEVPYTLSHLHGGPYQSIAVGWLKVSHRKLNPTKSTIYRPWHTHTKSDYQPLTPREVVEVEVEIWPTTAHIKKGHRIRLDVQPTDGYDHPIEHAYDETYHKGASNTIYTGPNHLSYLQLPVIPH